MAKDFDLIVLGSGPAGYRAAVQAAKLKKRVCIIEKEPKQLGGAWIHTGTIPSKTLRESMDAIQSVRFHVGQEWVTRMVADLSSEKLFGRACAVADYEESIVKRYLDRCKVDVLRGFGSFVDQNTIQLKADDGSTKQITGEFILISTGSSPKHTKELPCDGKLVVDADEILCLKTLPKKMIIYGAGVIGCEYACIFRALGVEVTIIDGRNNIMQFVDHEISGALRKIMEHNGIQFLMGSKLSKISTENGQANLELSNGQKLSGDLVFCASGRAPNVTNLNLEKLGIKLSDRQEILVNENFQTALPNIYAAGDVIGSPALAATAVTQGRHAACHMFHAKNRPFPKVFPIGVYTIPELSSIGKSEEELKAEKVEYEIGRAHYSEVARGFIRGDDHGLLKMLVCKKTQKILGVHIVGHDACNLVHIGLAFMQKGGHAQDFVDMIFNYPTLAEAYRIAAFNALNKIFPSGDIENPPAG